jgi:hypothetical protein
LSTLSISYCSTPFSFSFETEPGVASDKIQLSVKLLAARLRENLDATTAGPAVLGRVRILVDPDLLHRGRTDARANTTWGNRHTTSHATAVATIFDTPRF